MEYVAPMKLQATLVASTAIDNGPGGPSPHHPLTCSGELAYGAQGGLSCPHAEVGPEDRRTYFAVQQSVAILLLEEAQRLLGAPWLK